MKHMFLLWLSAEDVSEGVHYKKQSGIIVVCLLALVVFALMLWKLVALDAKLWYQTHYGQIEENGKCQGTLYPILIPPQLGDKIGQPVFTCHRVTYSGYFLNFILHWAATKMYKEEFGW